jgi:tetratricopeptide (TPR) repeat protein
LHNAIKLIHKKNPIGEAKVIIFAKKHILFMKKNIILFLFLILSLSLKANQPFMNTRQHSEKMELGRTENQRLFVTDTIEKDTDSILNQALELLKTAKIEHNFNHEAEALNTIGKTYFIKNELSKALDYFYQSLKISEKTSNKQISYKALCNIGLYHRKKFNFQQSIDYFEKAKKIAIALNDSLSLALVLADLGCNYYRISQYQQASHYYQEALRIYESLGNTEEIINLHVYLGAVFFSMSFYKTAIPEYQKALNMSLLFDNKKRTGSLYNNLGVCFLSLQDYSKALTYFQTAMLFFKNVQFTQGIATTLSHLAQIFLLLKDYDKALINFEESKTLFESIGELKMVASTIGNIASTYKVKNEYPKALIYYQKALVMQTEQHDLKEETGLTELNMGELFILMNDIKNAINHLNNSLRLFTEATNQEGIAKVYHYFGKLYATSGSIQKAIDSYFQSIEIARLIDNKELLTANYFALSEIYRKRDYCKEAGYYTNLFLSLRDSISKSDLQIQLSEMQIQFETEKKDAAIEWLKQENKLKSEKQKQERYVFLSIILGFLFILLFSLIAVYQNFSKLKAYKVLVKKNLQLIQQENQPHEKQELLEMYKINDNNTGEVTEVDNENAADLLERLIQLMKNENIYADKEISLNKIAELLQTNRTYLSEILNKELKTNFNDFINEYRIKKSCILLTDSKLSHLTMESIALMVGFNSRSTFNTAFKKLTGVTPSYFKNSGEKK